MKHFSMNAFFSQTKNKKKFCLILSLNIEGVYAEMFQ